METDQLWTMRKRLTEGVVACYEDDNMDALGILLSLELKVTQVLGERQAQSTAHE